VASQLVTVQCPTCRGKGSRRGRECPLCKGKQTIEVIEGDDDDD
jgi:DnaJ-class molecular chaperone